MDDYVFWFDVSVDDAQRVDLVDRVADLLDDRGDFSLLHGLGPFELMEELPACADLKYNEDVRLIVEVAVHLDDIGMVEVELDFHFSDELLNDLLLLDQPLLDHLESADKACVTLPMIANTY